MATSKPVPELNRTDHAVLGVLSNGARTQGYLIDNTAHTRGQVQRSLDRLHMGEYIERLHDGTALYEITKKGRRIDSPQESDHA